MKFGPEAAEAQDTPVVTVVRFLSVEQEETMLLELLIQIQDVSIQYVLADHGLVVNHTLAQRVWDVVHT